MPLGHGFKLFLDLGMRSYIFIHKLENEHFGMGCRKEELLSHK